MLNSLPHGIPYGLPHSVSHQPSQQSQPILTVLQEVALQYARVHECSGRARVFFAMLVAAKVGGPVFWIGPKWQRDHPNPDGMQPYAKPQNFTFIATDRPEETLWTMEETLRCGAVPLVVADMLTLPGLTAVRRLHLAAERTTTNYANAPLGLLLTHGEGGGPGVESRWHITPAHTLTEQRWHLTRTRARTAPVKQWMMAKTKTGLQIRPYALHTDPQSKKSARL